MLAYCGRPAAAAFCDPFPYIVPRASPGKRSHLVFIRLGRSLGVALATAIMSQSGSMIVRIGRRKANTVESRAWNLQVRGQHLFRSQSVTSGALRFFVNPSSPDRRSPHCLVLPCELQVLRFFMSFEHLGLQPELLRAVAEKGYTTPSPI